MQSVCASHSLTLSLSQGLVAPRIEFIDQVTDQEAGAIRSKAQRVSEGRLASPAHRRSTAVPEFMLVRETLGCVTFEGRVPTHW